MANFLVIPSPRAVNHDDLAETCPIVLLALSTAQAAVGRALIKWSVEALS
jgi:hypothetical protein